MIRRDLSLVGLLCCVAIGTTWAQGGSSHHPTKPPAQKRATTGAGPGMGMMGMQGGQMKQMMEMMHPTMAIDENSIYILRGNELLRLDKSTLLIISKTTIPPVEPPLGQPPTGSGPAMQGMSGMPSTRPGTQPTPPQPTTQQFDLSFMRDMIRHHLGAIEMSQLAVKSATHPELRQFAQNVIDKQTAQDQQFFDWLKSWSNVTVQPTVTPTDAIVIAKLRNLKDGDFEILYMQAMIKHHSQGIEMARMAERKAVHPELKRVAGDIAMTQSAEINQLKMWLSQWYGIKGSSNKPA